MFLEGLLSIIWHTPVPEDTIGGYTISKTTKSSAGPSATAPSNFVQKREKVWTKGPPARIDTPLTGISEDYIEHRLGSLARPNPSVP